MAYRDTHLIYKCVIGSRAYGLANTEEAPNGGAAPGGAVSDTDYRGIYNAPPASLLGLLAPVPDTEGPGGDKKDADEMYYELKKFLLLALKANPTILECLFTPLVEYCSPVAEELLRLRTTFISKRIFSTYSGYAQQQFDKMQGAWRPPPQRKHKFAMHTLRLLYQCVQIYETGTLVLVLPEPIRDYLRQVRAGNISVEEILEQRLFLAERILQLHSASTLPSKPDEQPINDFLLWARGYGVRKI